VAITVIHEPDDVPRTATRELCCFCYKPTRFWVAPMTGESVACCPGCASAHDSCELPTKRAWWRDVERKIAH